MLTFFANFCHFVHLFGLFGHYVDIFGLVAPICTQWVAKFSAQPSICAKHCWIFGAIIHLCQMHTENFGAKADLCWTCWWKHVFFQSVHHSPRLGKNMFFDNSVWAFLMDRFAKWGPSPSMENFHPLHQMPSHKSHSHFWLFFALFFFILTLFDVLIPKMIFISGANKNKIHHELT